MQDPYRLGPGVFVPARTAALLSRALDLDARRVAWRGSDAEVDAVLAAWRRVVLEFVDDLAEGRSGRARGFADETVVGDLPQPAAPLEVRTLGSLEVAELLDVSEQAVTKAARCGRLIGQRVAGRWVFTPEAVAVYRTRSR